MGTIYVLTNYFLRLKVTEKFCDFYIFAIFAKKEIIMKLRLSENDFKNLIKRIVNKSLQNNIFDESIISEMIDDEVKNIECEMIHEKNSYKKYGNASDYGYNSWIEFWQKKSPYGELLNTIKRCPCCGNLMNKPVGGHVQDAYGTEIFITPICDSCNSSAANDEKFRKTPFRVKSKYLVEFDYDELRLLRHSK